MSEKVQMWVNFVELLKAITVSTIFCFEKFLKCMFIVIGKSAITLYISFV